MYCGPNDNNDPIVNENAYLNRNVNTEGDQDEVDLFISNFKKRKQYEKYKEMHRFICVGEDIPELDTNDDESNKIATIPDVLEKELEINYETVKKSENILVGHDIGEYYFFENDNYKRDWESKERIVKKFLRLHYKNIYQIRAKKLLDNFRKWKASNNNELDDFEEKYNNYNFS
ncbi:hypothetical protein LY90DRAFT_511593 [Neocallimastix californiae]|uniref:Uncharacterized protein n=1 Tax=Neocallimastix californiae TaxID=1754190 RepID=A0A1Y2BNU3_9FUNG|nr:hypothetical protein LY90DRAFT_511593 [Neocallimastix californiae]|eukprot:ORY36247.1 hypothetical protein LY90DRAFT_511593 [Neocallimastix californiae]